MVCRCVAWLVTVVAFAAGLAGCGDDGGSGPNEDQALTKEQYVERANSICARLGVESEKLAEETFGDLGRRPTEEELEAYERKARELRRQTLADLRALPVPEGDEDEVAAIYDELERVIDELEAVPPSTPGEPGDVSLDRFRELANDYGLMECGGG
jgi:hypothetical protein